MASANHVDANEVRLALTARAVLEFYDWKVKRSGDELESTACPERNDHHRRAFVINANTGRWRCFPCATSGDLFDFIAAVERLQMPRDFSDVVDKAGAIAGIGPSSLSDDERTAKRDEWRRRQQEQEAREVAARAERDAAAVPLATSYWERLLAEHDRGLAYLHERALDEVVSVVDAVRFDPRHAGSPALALFTSQGDIRNVVARRVPELGEPKTPGLRDCPTLGTFINAVCQIEHERDVVLTEGVMDSITARLAWRYAIVLGAHGASNLPTIASAIAPVIVNVKTRLIIVPHRDRRGLEESYAAGSAALAAGLSIGRGTLQIVKLPDKDLNDAWRHGWRPAA
jgi:hypothetical protein